MLLPCLSGLAYHIVTTLHWHAVFSGRTCFQTFSTWPCARTCKGRPRSTAPWWLLCSKLSHDGPTPSEPPPSDGKRQKPDRDDGRNYHVAVPGWFRFITFKTSGILTKEIFLNRPCRSGSSFTRWPRHCSNSCSSLSRRRLWPMWGQEVVATKDS